MPTAPPIHCTPPVYPPIAPGRFAGTIKLAGRDSHEGCRVGLIGLPDDTGVTLNAGRPGAKDGPRAFREALARFGSAETMDACPYPGVFDAGDVTPGATLDETHDRVSAAAEALVRMGLIPVGIGGGHDLTYALVRGAGAHSPIRAGVYLDAHLDVRDQPGSGMPMRALIERCGVGHLVCIGAEPMVNTHEHAQWLMHHGGEIIDAAGARTLTPERLVARLHPGPRFVSLDLDVIQQAAAPGVSASNPLGLFPMPVAAMVEALAALPATACLDIMELNPAHDEGGRTARLASAMFLSMLRGIARREG